MRKLLPFLIGLFIVYTMPAQTDLIISEYVEGWSNNKAIEIYNPTSSPINLSAYRLVRYSNGIDVPPAQDDWTIGLPDVNLEPYRTYVCVIDKRDPNGTGQEAPVWDALADRADVFLCPNYNISKTLYHNGDDAVALEKTDGTLVDLFGRWGPPRPAEALVGGSNSRLRCWTDTAPFFTGVGVGITADHTLYRRPNILNGVTENPDMFNPLAQWDSLPANTFNHLGWHKCDAAPANHTPVFEKEEFTFKVWKQAENGSRVGTIKATDAEDDPLRFYINSGNFIYNNNDVRKTPFSIDRANGELTVNDASALLESPWDTLFLNVSVTDGFSESAPIRVIAVISETEVSVDMHAKPLFMLYPNPVSDNTVNINAYKNMKSVAILNTSGQLLKRKEVSGQKAAIKLDNLPFNVYMVEVVYTDNSKEVRRLVKN